MSKRIVTISREFGSGGRTVGRMVAEQLGYKFYDRELIQLVAKQSGFALEFVEETGEYSTTSSLLYNLSMGGTYAQAGFSPDHLPPADKVQILQNNIIRDLADQEPCVIVGRSADYILRDRTDCLNVFVHADREVRMRRAVEEYGFPEKNIEKLVAKKDKARASQYRHYTDRIWGMADNYHLTLNSGIFGLEKCCEIIVSLAK